MPISTHTGLPVPPLDDDPAVRARAHAAGLAVAPWLDGAALVSAQLTIARLALEGIAGDVDMDQCRAVAREALDAMERTARDA